MKTPKAVNNKKPEPLISHPNVFSFLFAIMLFILQFTTSDYSFGIFIFFSCSILGCLYSYFYVLFYFYSWFLLLDMPWMISYILKYVPDEGYYRNASCTLNLMCTFLLLSLGQYHCWWTISPRGYHPQSSQCICTDIVY